MKVERPGLATLVLAAVLAAGVAGCGQEDGNCPDLSGAWVIEQHCLAMYVGQTANMLQAGCSLQGSGGGFDGFAGAVTASSAISFGGVVDTDVINCAGTATPFQIMLNCNTGECDVVLRR